MNINKFVILFGLIFCFVSESISQDGSVRGFVYDKENGEPII